MSFRAFGAPHLYVQGPGALSQLAELAGRYGRRPFVIADAVVTDLLGARLRASLAGLDPRFATFGGECTAAEIDRLADEARTAGADLVVGVGGGKAIDTAKGARTALGRPLIVVPTIASNDSPTSRLIVLYDEAHVLSEVRLMPANPDVVLVDTAVIAGAPARFFIAGIGDALSKKFEVAQCARAGGANFYKGRPTRLAQSVASSCYDVIRDHAEAAVAAVRRDEANDAVEDVVEATILMSGLAFESGGLSIAHSLTRGFSALPDMARFLHGEQVAFGLLVQLRLEGRDGAFIADLLELYRRLGLPRSLTDFGVRAPDAARKIAEVSLANAPYMRNFEKNLSLDDVRGAIEAC